MNTPPTPPIVDRHAWMAARSELLVREKAHTREGDAIAAARRRLPMTEVDATEQVVGDDGPVSFLDLFDGRDQLITYQHMWHLGEPIENQCMGCTATIWSVHDDSYLHHRGISYAVLCEGPWEEVRPFRDFMGYTVPWYSMADVEDPAICGSLMDEPGLFSCYLRVGDRAFLTNETICRGTEAMMATAQLLDLTVYGRQEEWEDSPEGWPRHPTATWWIQDGRPVPQWTRPGVTAVDGPAQHCH